MEDIPLLVDHFITRFNRIQGKKVPGVRRDALSLFMAHSWPGNVRELENVIERAFVLCEGDAIGVGHLPEELGPKVSARLAPENAPPPEKRVGLDTTRQLVEAEAIRAALERNHWNRLKAARELGIHKSTLFRKVKALGIELPEQDGRSTGPAG
jgi:DNA-binding NtrC family response regulator